MILFKATWHIKAFARKSLSSCRFVIMAKNHISLKCKKKNQNELWPSKLKLV